MASSRRRRARRQKILVVVIVIVLIVLIAGLTMMSTVLKRFMPARDMSDYAAFYGLENESDMVITYDNEVLDDLAIMRDGEVYVSYDTVHEYLNKRFFWDDAEHLLRYTLPEGIVNVTEETTDYTIGKETQTADHVIFMREDDEAYISLSFVRQYTNLRYSIYEEPNRVVISDQWGDLMFSGIDKDTEVRELGGIKSPVLTQLQKGDLVTVLETMDTWTKVCTEDGFVGYVKNKVIGDEQEVLYSNDEYEEPQFSHIVKNGRINMAWHQVTNQTANGKISSVLASTKGLNVISPTWFYLDDNYGGITSLASTEYVNYCHQQGVEVWGLISNLENPDVNSTTVLNITSCREQLINNLVAEAVRVGMDGINVDFEALEGAAGVGFLQFIRELSLKCEGNDLVLSVDNYPPAAYNAYYSWDEQAVFADYVILMAYDEHYNGSEEAGSVASIGFVNTSVENMLSDVPAEQLILGIPFYTRLWKLSPSEDGSGVTTLTSEALGMSDVEARVSAGGAIFQWLDDSGQYYAEYDQDGSTYKVWAEEDKSIEQKLEVMRANGLAGASFWKLGYEKNTVWDTIIKYLSE